MKDSKTILPQEYGWIGNAAIWVLGSFWWQYKTNAPLWECAPFGDYYILTFSTNKAPFFLRRWVQRILMGTKYRRVRVAPPSIKKQP